MLLDTSGLLCLHHRAEPFHQQAIAAYKVAPIRLIHNYILAEFVALANARRIPRLAALSFVADLLETPDIEMVWISESLIGVKLFKRRCKTNWPVCAGAD